jgi:hypothetical protein
MPPILLASRWLYAYVERPFMSGSSSPGWWQMGLDRWHDLRLHLPSSRDVVEPVAADVNVSSAPAQLS